MSGYSLNLTKTSFKNKIIKFKFNLNYTKQILLHFFLTLPYLCTVEILQECVYFYLFVMKFHSN